jgi:hypothetical protein
MPNDSYGRAMSRGAFPMSEKKDKGYTIEQSPWRGNKAQKGDIELPNEKKKQGSVRQSLESLRGIVDKSKRDAEEFKRRAR